MTGTTRALRRSLLATALLPLLALTACAPTPSGSGASAGSASAGSSSAAPAPSESTTAGSADSGDLEGATLRFRSDDTTVDVRLGETNPTIQDLVGRLPLQLTAEEFNGREKIADIPDGLTTAGSPGSDPEDGDLIYYTPWGNLGFYYDTSGVGYSNQTIHIGTYDATRQQLNQLEGPVTVALVR